MSALDAFLGEVEHVPPAVSLEDRLRTLTSSLRDLAADTTWLAPYLETHPVEMMPTGDQVAVLARTEAFLIRATLWPTAWRWVPRSTFHVYNTRIAHGGRGARRALWPIRP